MSKKLQQELRELAVRLLRVADELSEETSKRRSAGQLRRRRKTVKK
jgi:hypothetical protein